MCEVLSKFSTACKNKINTVLEKTETWALLKNEKFKHVIHNDPRYRQVSESLASAAISRQMFQSNYAEPASPKTATKAKVSLDEKEEQKVFDEQERQVEGPAYDGKRISEPSSDLDEHSHLFPKATFITDLALLANIHDSLTWLVRNIQELGKPKLKKEEENKSDSSQGGGLGYKSKVQPHWNKSNINVDIKVYADEFRRLSETCLLALRTELRLWVFCYLDFIRGVPFIYVPELNNDRPDVFFTDLNKYLQLAYETLSFHLPQEKVYYLFSSLPSLTTQILFNSLPKIRDGKIDKFGINRMKRNIQALQTNFQNMNVITSDDNFERVKKFYGLLEMSKNDLQEQLKKR